MAREACGKMEGPTIYILISLEEWTVLSPEYDPREDFCEHGEKCSLSIIIYSVKLLRINQCYSNESESLELDTIIFLIIFMNM
jgi:hypothetical protein